MCSRQKWLISTHAPDERTGTRPAQGWTAGGVNAAQARRHRLGEWRLSSEFTPRGLIAEAYRNIPLLRRSRPWTMAANQTQRRLTTILAADVADIRRLTAR